MLNANRDIKWEEVNINKDDANRYFKSTINLNVSFTKEETKDLNINQLINKLNIYPFYSLYEDIPRVLLEYLDKGLTDLNDFYSIFHNAKKEDLKAHDEIVRDLKAFCSLIPGILKREFNK